MQDLHRTTGVMPQALRDRPQRIPEVELVRRIFALLSRARKWADGTPQPIEIGEFMALIRAMDIQGDLLWTVLDWIQDMDTVYLERMAEKAKSAKPDVAGSKTGRR